MAWTLIFAQVQIAFAQLTPLGDVPIAAKVAAKPNIVYTLDDSGSMQFNYLPDYIVSTAAVINITITRVGAVATATGAVNAYNVGDWVNIVGANQPEYNGYVQITGKPVATKFTYAVAGAPATPATIAAGYPAITVVASSAYCRAGSTTAVCAAQNMAIASAGTAVAMTSMTRAGPIATGGPVTATATGTAANFATLTTGDTILIQNTAALPIPATTSAPYYGVFTITKTSPTTFTYTINAVANITPLAAANGKQFVIQGGSQFAAPPLHAADFNRLAYNPNVTYQAPLKADGTPLTNTGTDANGNYGSTPLFYGTASVDRDPFSAFETAAGVAPMWAATVKDDLSIKIAVPLYCNTDWPALVNDPNWAAGPNGATVLDAGDANGQYASGSGAWCRINGTKYDVSAASSAPAAAADYNYPWQPSTAGVTGPQYFYRVVPTKTLWCDQSSPYYPRTAVISSCLTGTPTLTAPVAQTCNVRGLVCNPNPALTNYTPAGCKPSTPGWVAAEWCAGGTAPATATGTLPECKACSCKADTAPVPAKTCSLSGLACNVNADCPPFSTTISNCSGGIPVYTKAAAACTGSPTGVMWDPAANSPSGVAPSAMPQTTLLADANGAGVVCRHNNLAYAVGGVIPAVATYPRTAIGDVDPANKSGLWPPPYTNQTGAFTTAATGGCPPVGGTVQIPRHYYVIDSVQFCDNRTVTADVQWKGFGTGVCQPKNDLQRFKEVKYGQFTRIDLFPTNGQTFTGNSNLAASATPYPNGRAWLAATSPGPDNSESINYANWYAYYSTRLNAAKTTSSIAFSALTNVAPDPIAYRVGFHNLGEEPTGYGGSGTPVIWLDVKDWDLTQRTAWYGKLFGISVATYKTPTLDAMLRIGNLFETGGASGLAASINPLPAAAKDPIDVKPDGTLVSCQNNYHILFTDGKTNQATPTTTAGEQDATIPASLVTLSTTGTTADQVMPNFTTAGPWPKPFVQGTPVSDTLADIASYYWSRDLRPALKNDVPNQSGAAGGDLDWTKDVAWWQHVNFSAISFGAEGTLDASQQPVTMASIKSGALSWPNLTQPNNPIYPTGSAAGAVAVDDLWHSTVMSRGSFVFAKDPTEVAYGLANILAGIQNQRKSRSGAAFSGQVLDDSNNIIFVPTIEPGWAGDLIKIEIFPDTAAEKTRWWTASATLAAQIDPIATGVAEPWMDEAHRRVVTLTGASGPGVAFRHSNLTAAQKLSLAAAPAGDTTEQQKLVAYLRGGSTFTLPGPSTVQIEGTSIGQFRKRFGALGDLSNAEPVIVNAPERPYQDATDPGYKTWKASKAGRATVVVAPANDGMVHVFDAGPMPSAGPPPVVTTAGGGTELFAFIPKALFRGVAGNPATEDVTAIQALAYQDGGVPIYHHHMYVDSSPRTADVDFSNGAGTGWHSIVVGGLGKGGNSYYALDLTDVTVPDEATAAAKVLWEWSDPELKYSYGRPVIVKVRDSAYPTGRWVVIVTGGYNNASGKGKIFFLDAATGTPIGLPVTTSAGTAANPSGLAQIHAFVANENNQIAEQIYGGDLQGNFWRVDVSAPDQYKAATAVLFAQLTDGPGGDPQPVTTAPQIEIDLNNGVDRYVFIGTGRLLDTTDLTISHVTANPQTQTMYAIRDGTLTTFETAGLPIQPRVTMNPINPDGVSAIVGGAPNGWYHDLSNVPGNAERIVVDVQANVNIAEYIGTAVQDDPCLISLPAYLYAHDYTTGKSLILDSTNAIAASIYLPNGAAGAITIGRKQPDGSQTLGVLVSGEIPGTQPFNLQNPVTGPGSRLSWRLLGGE